MDTLTPAQKDKLATAFYNTMITVQKELGLTFTDTSSRFKQESQFIAAAIQSIISKL